MHYCVLRDIFVDKCKAEVAVSCREWIVDILKIRFNRIYNDSSIHAIKHLCGHIDFFTTVWKKSGIILVSFRSSEVNSLSYS